MHIGSGPGYGCGTHDTVGGCDLPRARRARWREIRDLHGTTWHEPRLPVLYVLNSESYRAPEWDSIRWSESVVFFGCSEMFGVGIPDTETIPSLYTARTGIPAVNLGWPGASNGQIAQVAVSVAAQVRPRAVVVAWTVWDRYHCYHQPSLRWYTMGSWNVQNWDHFDSEDPAVWRAVQKQYVQFLKTGGQAEHFLQWRDQFHHSFSGVPVTEYSAIDRSVAVQLNQSWWDDMIPGDWARDGSHSNGVRNTRILNHLLEHYPQLPR